MGIPTASRTGLAVAAMGACTFAHAAGGHFSVDDASILDPGQWEQETWFSQAHGGARLLHAGLNFRVGPVELDGAVERAHGPDPSATTSNLEVKWAHALGNGFAVGLDVQPVWTTQPKSGYALTRFYGITSWKPNDTVLLNLNAGHDWVRGGPGLARGGASVEWTPTTPWTFIAERYLDSGSHFLRAGARWSPSKRWTWDLSYAHHLAGPASSTWTLGLDFHDD